MATANATKNERVCAEIRRRILDGTYPPGETLCSERALAKEFSVTHVTVRRALARLAAEDMIVKRPHCRSVVRDLPDTIPFGIALPHYAQSSGADRHPIPEILNAAVAHEIDPHEHAVHLIHYRPGRFRTDAAQTLVKRGARSLLLWPDATLAVEEVKFCIEAGMRVALLRSSPQLLELGHRDVLIAMQTFQTSRQRRERIARHRLREYSIARPRECFVDIPNPPGKGPDYAGLLERLASCPAPTAVIVSNEGDAARVFRHCFRHGIRVPADLSLAAVADNMPWIHPVPLTASNTFEMHVQAARQAIRELLRLLAGDDHPHREIALQCRVNWTASLGPPRSEEVAEAEPGVAVSGAPAK